MAKSFRFLWLAAALTLALAGCQQPEALVKPTPTAVAVGAGGGVFTPGRIVAGARVAPGRRAALSFPAGGMVTRIAVEVGERVEAGQLLVQLDTTMLDQQLALAEANLAGAKAKLGQLSRGPSEQDRAAAEQNLASAQALYDELIAGPAASETAATEAALAAAQQQYAEVVAGPNAKELEQLKALAENAKSAMDQAQAAYDLVRSNPNIAMLPQSVGLQQATNNYRAAVAAYEAAASHPTAAEVKSAAAEVAASQAALDRMAPKDAQIQAALAAVENAKAQLSALDPTDDDLALLEANVAAATAARDLAAAQRKNATLVAPFAGTVMKLDIAAGEYAAPGLAILQLADTSSWQIETTDLTELNVAEVGRGAEVSVTFDAIPDLTLQGHVGAIEPYGETKLGDIVYTVHIVLDRQDDRLLWNMTAKASIEPQ